MPIAIRTPLLTGLMPSRWLVAAVCVLAVSCGASASESTSVGWLVRDGQPAAVLLPQNNSEGVLRAVVSLQTHLERASGTTLPIMDPDEADAVNEDMLRVIIGFGPMTEALGIENDLGTETFRVLARDGHLVFIGADRPYGEATSGTAFDGVPIRHLEAPVNRSVDGSWATQWAVGYFLDRVMGVRWLWPGELGTYVPQSETIAVPGLDVRSRPEISRRMLRVNLALFRSVQERLGATRLIDEATFERVVREAQIWLAQHQMGLGDHPELDFTHSFGRWWNRYHQRHPDIFARTPAGHQQPYPDAQDVKLCVANEKVDELVIQEWRAAGAPDTWPIAMNDHGGYCVCEDCRAMDGVTHSETEVWNGAGNLSGRYVRFWNRLLGKMREINPDVRLTGLAYRAAQDAPPAGIRIAEPGSVILSFVHHYGAEARANWHGWHSAGAYLQLRPNWWYAGGPSPHLHFRPMGEFFRFAQQHSMFGYDFDELQGNWGAEGFNYYLIARLSARPDLDVDDVLDEYVGAFGDAAPAIRRYLDYWHDEAERLGYRISGVRQPDGRWEALVGDDWPWGRGPGATWYGLPFLFNDDVLQPAYRILDDAAASVASDNEEVQARIAFLRDGLKHVELTREVMRHGYPQTRPEGSTQADFDALLEQLYQARSELTPRHVVWGEVLLHHETRRGYAPAGIRKE